MPPPIKPPVKPFPEYKWRWAVLTPTESLNDPAIFFGVLRVLRASEGKPPSSGTVIKMLADVERETGSPVHLARTEERNLIRNSGQYWKALDLLGGTTGKITLTNFGRQVADGAITKAEFAATVIKTLELPNRHIIADTSAWDSAGLKIKPLELILEVLTSLSSTYGEATAFLTADELVRIIIPLAGAKEGPATMAHALFLHRSGTLDVSSWPDVAPEANDKRMAKEFLLFLAHYGFLEKTREAGVEMYYLVGVEMAEIKPFLEMPVPPKEKTEDTVRKVRATKVPSTTERKKVQREVTLRPGQAIFRNNVLATYGSKCLFTGVQLESVLEAAHIIPVTEKVIDDVANGICLRTDIHRLYDSGNLRIERSGNVHLTAAASRKENYALLPSKVAFPGFVNLDYVDWRWKYN